MKQQLPLRVKKYLLGPAEKAQIIAEMRAAVRPLPVEAWAMQFHRLPATIVKIATEAGVQFGEVSHDRRGW